MKSLISLLAFFTCLLLEQPTIAAVREEWIAHYSLSATGLNQAVSIALDAQGNAIVGGHGTGTNGDLDYVALKYSPAGQLMWQSSYGSVTNDSARGMAMDKSGNVVLTGTAGTVKWDSVGSEKWSAEYGGRALALDASGDVYLTGHREAAFSTVKLYRDAGTNLWERTQSILPGRPDYPQVLTVDASGNVYVGGAVTCYWEPRSSYGGRFIVSYNPAGTIRWQTPTSMSECTYSSIRMIGIGLDETGNLYEVAQTSPGSVETIGYSQTGNSSWFLYSSYVDQGLKAAFVDKEGFSYLTGASFNLKTFTSTIRVDKISPFGTNAWVAEYGGATRRSGSAIVADHFGNVFVAGQVQNSTASDDWVTIKYSRTGEELWVQRYDGPAHGDDVATAIAVAPDGSVYVTGWSTTSSNLVEITTIKYVQSASLMVESNRNVSLQFPGTPGATNRVQATTNFLQWLDLGFSIADTNGLLHFLDTNAPNHSFRFYRTVSP